MRTFKQFLLEEDTPYLMDILKRDCKPYLDQITHSSSLLFRGMKNFGEPQGKVKIRKKEVDYFKKLIRQDRQPKSTSPVIHQYVDDWFEKKFGVRPRGNAAFCHSWSASGRTEIYGKTAIIFPIGEFEVIWSKNVMDLYDDFENMGITRRSSREDVEFLLDDAKFKKGNLEAALWTTAEIMVIGSSYYVIPYDSIDIRAVYAEIRK